MDHTLKLLKQMAHGIAKQFGTSCEVVIHDLNKDLETSIVHIENGQVTNLSRLCTGAWRQCNLQDG